MQRVDQRVASARTSLLDRTVAHECLKIPVDGGSRQARGLGDGSQRLLFRAETGQGPEHRHGAGHGSAGAVRWGANRVQQRELPLAIGDRRVSHNADSIQWSIFTGHGRRHQAPNFPVREFQEQTFPVIRRAGTYSSTGKGPG